MDNPQNQPGSFGPQPPRPDPANGYPPAPQEPMGGYPPPPQEPMGGYPPPDPANGYPPPPAPMGGYPPPPDPMGGYPPPDPANGYPPPPPTAPVSGQPPPPDWQTQPVTGAPPPPMDPMTGAFTPPKKKGASPVVWAVSGGAAVVLIIIVVVVLVASGGVGGIGSEPEDSDLKAEGTTTSSVCSSSSDGKWDTTGTGDLYGANFALQIDCVAVFTEQGPDTTGVSGIDRELGAAPEGHEIVVVQFASTPAKQPVSESPDSSKVTGTLKLGDKTWTFSSGGPEKGGVYVAAVTTESDLELEIIDDELSQGMDLRDRKRIDEIEALYDSGGYSKTTATEYASATVDAEYISGSGQRWWVENWSYNVSFTATRGVYNEDTGWMSGKDRAVFSLEFSWVYKGKDGIEWQLNEGDLEIGTGNGDYEIVDNTSDDSGTEITYLYYLDVPADETTMTVEFAPSGPIDWPAEGVEMPLSSGAKSHTLTFSL